MKEDLESVKRQISEAISDCKGAPMHQIVQFVNELLHIAQNEECISEEELITVNKWLKAEYADIGF